MKMADSYKESLVYIDLKREHKEFVSHLLAGDNGIDAYMKAYPRVKYSTANSKASILYNKDYIQQVLQLANRDKVASIEEAGIKTIQQLQNMAFADVGGVIDMATGKPKALADLPPALRQSISEVEIDGDRVKYKLGGKIKSLELLAKITKLTDAAATQVNIQILNESERDEKIQQILIKAITRGKEGA